MDFKNSKLNIPTQMNPADAMEEINRANKSIQNETLSELLAQRIKSNLKEIKNQKIVKPILIFNDRKSK